MEFTLPLFERLLFLEYIHCPHLLTDSNANYGFLPKEQSQQSASPTKRVSLSSNCEEQPFIQQLFASIDNQVIYKPDK